MVRLLFLLALLAASSFAIAQTSVYKWKDANGVLHYTDAPPPQGVSFSKVKANLGGTGASTETGGETKNASATDKTDKDKQVQNDAAAGRTTQAQANMKLCEQARANVVLLQGTAPLAISKDGKTETLPDSSRAEELKRAQAATALYCM